MEPRGHGVAATDPDSGERVARRYRFGDFTLDLEQGFLSRDSAPLELRPKPFALLAYLVERHGRVVSKDELVDAVWHGVAVTDNSLAQCVAELRRLLGHAGRDVIRTLPRRGYVFAAPVEPPAPLDRPPQARATSAATAPIARIPAPVTRFFGREREIHEMAGRLERSRLLTLTGPGGTGKTRLAQEAATSVRAHYADGVAFISLAAISEPVLVGREIARALGVPERATVSPLDALVAFIGERRWLLVLDNFEHVALAAPVVSRLLADCANLQVLVTSRAPLKIAGEYEYALSPLTSPPPGSLMGAADLDTYPATALFVDRLRAVRPEFRVTEDAATVIAELCRRLDGLPLAIELAAARAKLFTPRAMLARLDRALDLLSAAGRDRPPRHHSLRQAIAWSYDLLPPAEQSFFRQLAVFIDGCALDDSPELTQVLAPDGGDVWQRSEALIDHSLVVTEDSLGHLPRLRMLDTIREFALERLQEAGEMAAARRRHAMRFLALAEEAEPHLTGPQQGAWFDRLEREHANLRDALAWARQKGEAEVALRLGAALWRFWLARGYLAEGRERLEQLTAMPGTAQESRLRARVLHGAATLIHEISEFRAARPLAEESLAIARTLGDQRLLATGLNSLGWLLVRTGDGAAGEATCEESLAVNRELGDPRGVAVALHNLAWLAVCRGEYGRACALQEQSLTWRRERNDPRGLAYGQTHLAWSEIGRGGLARARQLLTESRATFEQLGDRQLLAWALSIEGMLERADHRPTKSAAQFAASLELWRAVGNLFGIAFSLIGSAEIALDQHDYRRAAPHLDEAVPLVRRIGECWATARALTAVARLAEGDGDRVRAGALYEESLAHWMRLGNAQESDACRSALVRLNAAT